MATRQGKVPVPYFSLSDCSKRPNAVSQGANVGSEGEVAHIIRDVSSRLGAGRCLDHPSILSMRASKIRHMVYVDDFVSSGNRVLEFYKWLFEHPTLISWRSFGWLTVSIVSYCCTEYALRRIAIALPNVRCHYHRLLEKGRTFWSDHESQQVARICSKYAARKGWHRGALGFNDQFTLILFEHKCPNTTPPIVWAKWKDWVPLVDPRPQFSFDTWPQDVDEQERARRALLALGQHRLSRSSLIQYVSPEARLRFVVLAAVARGHRDRGTICRIAELSQGQGSALLADCRRFRWITDDLRITITGLAELARAKKMRILTEGMPPFSDDLYVPQSFRGAKGVI